MRVLIEPEVGQGLGQGRVPCPRTRIQALGKLRE